MSEDERRRHLLNLLSGEYFVPTQRKRVRPTESGTSWWDPDEAEAHRLASDMSFAELSIHLTFSLHGHYDVVGEG